MNQFMATPIDNTKDGECSQCGRCCSAILPVNPNQILRIKKYLKKHPEIKPHNYTPLLSSNFMDICPFLSEDKKCMIYEVRPDVCRRFICSKYKDPNYKPMDYRHVKLINMLTTFSNEPCPQAPNLDGLNEILEDQKERAYGKKECTLNIIALIAIKSFKINYLVLFMKKIEHIGYSKDVAEIISCGYHPCDYCANAFYVYGCEQDCQHTSECMAKHKWAKFKYSEGRDERA